MKKKAKRYWLKDTEIAESLKKNAGLYSYCAKELGVATSTISRRVEKSEKLQKVVDAIVNQTLDIAEAKLIEHLGKGQAWAICFYLKTKGKQRGYVQNSTIEIDSKSGPVKVDISESELDKIIEAD